MLLNHSFSLIPHSHLYSPSFLQQNCTLSQLVHGISSPLQCLHIAPLRSLTATSYMKYCPKEVSFLNPHCMFLSTSNDLCNVPFPSTSSVIGQHFYSAYCCRSVMYTKMMASESKFLYDLLLPLLTYLVWEYIKRSLFQKGFCPIPEREKCCMEEARKSLNRQALLGFAFSVY